MTNLDTRGRQAAEGLKRQVAAARLPLAAPPSARPARGRHPIWSLAAGAVTAFVLVLGFWMTRPTVVADDVDEATITTPETTAATVPSTVPATAVPPTDPVIPAGDGSPSTSPPATADVTAPFIEITSPIDGSVFAQKTITFAGVTEPGARVFAGSYEADVDADGNWRIVLVLSPGANRATFTAMDAAGNTSSAMVSAVYEPPVEKKDVAGFFAENVYGSCVESPPFDVYHGKGEPGSTVFVVSEYGSGQATVGAEGGWELRVEFPGAPPGKVFAVKVKDSLGRSTIFEFVYAPK
ncbi:MAG TPA: hypothetical protein VIY70_11620 [Acidimicrobiia bacterium]